MKHANCSCGRGMACSVTGRNNEARNAGCEDVFSICETSRIMFYGLADGQSGKARCTAGGTQVLDAVFRFIAEKGIDGMRQYEHSDELQYELIRCVRSSIAALAGAEDTDRAEYASTLVVFAFDVQTRDYVLLHLGDGGIIACQNDGEIRMLSAPENGMTSQYTWLTTSQEALHHLRIGFGNLCAYRRILMITDGATVFARGKNIPERSRAMIRNGSREELVACLSGSEPTDDASFIVIDCPDSEEGFINSNKVVSHSN